MKERPILFSGEMVKAILEGRKTMTRRVVKPQPPSDGAVYQLGRITDGDKRNIGKMCWYNKENLALHVNTPYFSCPFGEIGDRLWVRETFGLVPATAYRLSEGVIQTINPTDLHEVAIYKCGWELSPPLKWRPSIFMPRWASRITLEITDIRAERLQKITAENAIGEGFGNTEGSVDPHYMVVFARFILMWDKLNIKRGYGWNTNPWVWVISFRPEETSGGVRIDEG